MRFKTLKTAIAVTAIMLLGCFPAFASSYKIGSVTIGFAEEKAEDGEIREAVPIVRGSHCEITDWECSHDYSDWVPGNKVTFNVTVEATDDYHFSKSDTSVKTSGKNTELSTKKVTTSKITAKVNYWPSMKFQAPENLIWEDDDEWVAVWDKVDHCSAYEVKIDITDDDKTTHKTITVTKAKVDLSSYATDGELTFSVRAIPKNDAQKKYYTSSDWVSMNDVATPSYENTSTGSFSGSDNNRTFITSDGTTASGWQYLNGTWYYFNPDNGNKMTTNQWMYINENWYYFDNDGSVVTGWARINEQWYCFNDSVTNEKYGAMLKGWVASGPGGVWYYLNDGSVTDVPEGACLTNTITPDGYAVDENGAWHPES